MCVEDELDLLQISFRILLRKYLLEYAQILHFLLNKSYHPIIINIENLRYFFVSCCALFEQHYVIANAVNVILTSIISFQDQYYDATDFCVWLCSFEAFVTHFILLFSFVSRATSSPGYHHPGIITRVFYCVCGCVKIRSYAINL